MRGMFCPVCHAEYRQGFTQCNDCGVNLVPSLAANANLSLVEANPNDDSVLLLWSGVDPRFFTALKDALHDAGIEYDENPAVPQLLSAVRRDTFQIRIRSADSPAAEKLLAEISGRDAGQDRTPLDMLADSTTTVDPFHLGRPVFNRAGNGEGTEGPSAQTESDADDVPEDFVEHFDPENATVEVWTGTDSEMAQVFQECLSNVGIGCVVNADRGQAQVFVTPAAEERAREVIREIEEATPMD